MYLLNIEYHAAVYLDFQQSITAPTEHGGTSARRANDLHIRRRMRIQVPRIVARAAGTVPKAEAVLRPIQIVHHPVRLPRRSICHDNTILVL